MSGENDGAAEVRRRVLDAEPVTTDQPAAGADTEPKQNGRKRRRWEPRFRVVADGVEKRGERVDPDTGETKTEWRRLCSPLRVLARTRDPNSEEWGLLLEIHDPDGKLKFWVMPSSLLAGDGAVLREKLLGFGVLIEPAAKAVLMEYLGTAAPENRVRTVNRIGWHDIDGRPVYALPDAVYGDIAGETVMVPPSSILNNQGYRIAGSLAEWQAEVGLPARGNSRLIFALSTAVAAPLLFLLGIESGGFHFVGGSSIGKTTLLAVAGSVWGGGGIQGFTKQWRSTDNGLEVLAAAHCDALLSLDEIAQIAPEAAATIAYMLSNGSAKQRAGRSGEARVTPEWRCLFLSSGEISLASKIAEAGKGRRVTAGQQVRVVDIRADAGAGHGIFEQLHGAESGAALSTHFRATAAQHYGQAGREWLARIAADPWAVADELRQFQKQFIAEKCPYGADGQVHRVTSRFALIAAAGELATALGIFPWTAGETTAGVARCFADWLKERGGMGSLEAIEAVATVRQFIEVNGNSRFEKMLDPNEAGMAVPVDRQVMNRAGFRKVRIIKNTDGKEVDADTTYFVFRESWKAEICAGLDPGFVARVLADRGILRKDADGKFTRSERLPGIEGKTRCYVISSNIFGAGDGER